MHHPAGFFARLSGRALWLCVLGSLLLAAPVWAQQKVRVGVYENSPKVAISSTGKPEGIFIDLIEAIAQDEGWQLEYVAGTWSEGLEHLERGEIDLMPDDGTMADTACASVPPPVFDGPHHVLLAAVGPAHPQAGVQAQDGSVR